MPCHCYCAMGITIWDLLSAAGMVCLKRTECIAREIMKLGLSNQYQQANKNWQEKRLTPGALVKLGCMCTMVRSKGLHGMSGYMLISLISVTWRNVTPGAFLLIAHTQKSIFYLLTDFYPDCCHYGGVYHQSICLLWREKKALCTHELDSGPLCWGHLVHTALATSSLPWLS